MSKKAIDEFKDFFDDFFGPFRKILEEWLQRMLDFSEKGPRGLGPHAKSAYTTIQNKLGNPIPNSAGINPVSGEMPIVYPPILQTPTNTSVNTTNNIPTIAQYLTI